MDLKSGRFKVERQVYQKFETMLIEKLHYLVFKDREVCEEGGVLRGYQLTYIPESLKKCRETVRVYFLCSCWIYFQKLIQQQDL